MKLTRNSEREYELFIPDGTVIDKPVEINIEGAQKELTLNLIIKIGQNAKLTLIEKIQNNSDQDLLYCSKIYAGHDSKFRLVTLQNLTKQSKITEIQEANAEKSADLHFINFQLGAKDVHSTISQVGLNESPTLNADVLCKACAEQKQQFDVSSLYKSSNGRGRIHTKGIAMDDGKISLNGIISIAKNGNGTDTYLRQDSLLLGKDASVTSSPKLNIENNDVKAGHGASITNLNEENLFYLMSRGISPDEAKKMMIKGFIAEQLDKISDLPDLRREIELII